ncbi:hypothetical protein, partial [Caballeronia sp. ATUFL_F2_KS42]|uniref:hypothetical protein n=1 Tax=Caballeronia sp. ATUFL_F2_KS42 TaxID=2921765 RepID=UPI002027E8DF
EPGSNSSVQYLLLFSILPNRSLTQRSDDDLFHPKMNKPSSDTSCETLDTFAIADSEEPAALAIKRPHLSAVSF